MTPPVRLRLSRAKGFNLQRHSLAENGLPAIVVARPSLWGNPFVVGRNGCASACVYLFEKLCAGTASHLFNEGPLFLEQSEYYRHFRANIHTLRGFNLACWCRLDAPCHADVLLKLACEAAP